MIGIATDYGLDCRRVGVRIPVGVKFFSSPRRLHLFWDPFNCLSSKYLRSFPEGKAAGIWSRPFTSRIRGSIHIPHTSSWRSASQSIKHRDNFTFCTEVRLAVYTASETNRTAQTNCMAKPYVPPCQHTLEAECVVDRPVALWVRNVSQACVIFQRTGNFSIILRKCLPQPGRSQLVAPDGFVFVSKPCIWFNSW
jgi:hypothetical protein